MTGSWRLCIALALCLALLAAACSRSTDDSGAGAQPLASSTTTTSAAQPEQGSASATGDAEYIFDQDELRTYELTIDPELLAEIDADPTAEEWVAGSLTFEGETLEDVGIRYKGSIGAFVGCVDGPNLLEPSGAKSCTKLSMKLKINEVDEDREFFGQRRLQFHAMNLDPTNMHERLGYWLFNEMGVPAPRAVHARLLINGEFAGLFVLVEQIDGRFTRANYDDGTGNLYKEVWPTTDEGTPVSIEALEEGLKTNEDDPPTFELMERFSTDLVAAGQVGSNEVIDEYMNIDEVLRYIAVDRVIRHDDGPFHWYCDEQCEPHNFYLYENPSAETIHLIPWDLDNAFENIARVANPVTPIADDWRETQGGCEPFPFGAFGLLQRSAACDPLVAAWTQYESEYAAVLANFVDGPFAEDVVNARLDEWSAQIEDVMVEAAEAHDDAPSVEEWEASVLVFRRDLATAHEIAREELAE